MDSLHAVRLLAFGSVVRRDSQYVIRKTIRWYSKTFHTPIERVEEMPLEDIFRAYFEEKYEEMSKEDLEQERQELAITESERQAMIQAEEEEEAEMWLTGRIIAAEEARKKLEKATASISELTKQLKDNVLIRPKELSESELPKPMATQQGASIPPNISMTFMSDAEMEAELEGFGAMGQPKKP